MQFRVGPRFKNSSAKARLVVNNQLKIKSIHNVIGTIIGHEEPDRYVLVGNHRDSIVFGAADASSGTSVTNEIARVFGELLASGWRPRRTIKICSWDAEELGMIGSTEWIEENVKVLRERAIAYINLDIAVQGSFVLRARSSPLLKQLTYKWAKMIKDPNAHDGLNTVYDIWLERTPSDMDPNKPMIHNLFSSSDYITFYGYLGIPCGDYGYWFGYDNQSRMYPVYHTQEDNFYWMKEYGDPHFQFHEVMAKFSGGILLDLADSTVLPFSASDYAQALNESYIILDSSPQLSNSSISLLYLQKAVVKFVNASVAFEQTKARVTTQGSSTEVRMLNDQIVQVEKAFIYPYGLPGHPQDRHVAFNFGLKNIDYGKATFPGITEALHLAKETGEWEEVKRQVSIAAHTVSSAADLIKPLTN